MKQYKLVGWHSNVHLHGHTKRFGKLGIEFPVTVEVDGSVDEPFVAINGMTLLLYWFVWEPVG